MKKEEESSRDRLIRRTAIGFGTLTAVLFIGSLIAWVNWPGIFKPMAYSMIGSAIVFLVLRSVVNYRQTFRVKNKRRDSLKNNR